MLLHQALLLGLFFFSPALLLLAGELVLIPAKRLHQFIRTVAYGRNAFHNSFRILEEILGGILEFRFGHCTACTPA